MTTGSPLTDDDAFLRLMIYLPGKINRCIELLADEYLKDTNLKSYYLPYIGNIKESDGISQKELKEHIPFDKSRISVVVHELIEAGLVVDTGTSRNSSLHLTPNGNAAFSICRMFMDIVRKEIFMMKDEDRELMRQKGVEFNEHLNDIIEKYTKQ